MNKYRLHIYFTIFLLFLVVTCVFSQGSYRFRHIKKADGLSSDDVLAIIQDKRGYLWIGTQNGLNRYDGYQFEVYKNVEGDSTSLSNNWINALYEDEDGYIWIATQGGGLNKLDLETGVFTRYLHDKEDPKSISDDEIWTIEPNDRNSLWIGTRRGGLNLLDKRSGEVRRWLPTQEAGGLASIEVTSVLHEEPNKAWIGTASGGFQFFDAQKGQFITKKGFDSAGEIEYEITSVRAMARDNESNVWIVDTRNLVKYMHDQDSLVAWTIGEREGAYIDSEYSKTILVDSRDNVWVGSKDLGLYLYDKKNNSFKNIKHSDADVYSLSHNDITVIFEDHSGLIWIGMRGGGLSVLNFRDMAFEHWTHDVNNPNSLIFKEVRAISEDNEGNIWLGTNLGFSKFNIHENKFTNFFDKKAASNQNRIRAFADVKGKVLIGTEGRGVLSLDPSTGNYSTNLIDAPIRWDRSRYVRAIHYHSDSTLWVGTYGGGLFELDPVTFAVKQQFFPSSKADSLRSDRVQVIAYGGDKELWIGTDKGLALFNMEDKKFTTWQKVEGDRTSLIHNKVRTVYQDENRDVWIGTRGGFAKLDRETGKMKRFTTENGLPSEIIFGIQPDGKGNLWLTTPNGLSKMNCKDETFKNIRIPQNNNLDMGAHAKMKDGRIIAGGKNGFVIFHPDSIQGNPHVPKIVFTNFLVNNKPYPFYNYEKQKYEIELNYFENDFSVAFSAFDFTDPAKNQYEYTLESSDGKKTVSLGNKRELSFSNVVPGEYTLHVIGSNNDGVWNREGAALHITINPPWWQTVWFRWAVILALIIGLVSFYRYRIGAVKRKNEELDRLVKIRTKELEERQEEILVQNEEIKQQSEEIASQRDNLEVKNQEIESAYKNIQLLSQFGQHLTATLSFEEIHDIIFANISQSIEVDAFGLGLYKPEKKIIEYHAFFENGVKQEYFTRTVQPQESFSSLAIERKKSIFENDIESNWNNYFEKEPNVQTKTGARSILALPILAEETVLGVMTAYSTKNNAFSSKTQSFLTGLASYVSIAISNANLYREVNRKNEHISSSIQYAKQIQQSILPIQENVDSVVDSFVLFMPKDIVSGDFYMFIDLSSPESDTRDAIFAVVDCTGHGVPGAFMSLIGNRILNQIINERKIYSPAAILEELDSILKKALKQDQTENNDGMDVSMCRITGRGDNVDVEYAGAKRPLILTRRNGEVEIINGTRRSIGGVRSRKRIVPFEEQHLTLAAGTMVYLTSDGFIDQSNQSGKRLGTPGLIDALKQMHGIAPELQLESLQKLIHTHMEGVEQRDDITLWGICL